MLQSSPAARIRERFIWFDTVVSDKRISNATFRVAYVISQHINRETCNAWPSLTAIAEKATVSEATVERAIKNMETLGYLHIFHGTRGRGNSNTYSLKTPTIGVNEPLTKTRKTLIRENKNPNPAVPKTPMVRDELTDRTNLINNPASLRSAEPSGDGSREKAVDESWDEGNQILDDAIDLGPSDKFTEGMRLTKMLDDDVGPVNACRFIDSYCGDLDEARAVLTKIETWDQKQRVAYVEQILQRRYA